ncbi:MAG: cupin domain-containing protein [Brevundimonas sp.]|uniref:JmjC domain-containing protein n=1 Tax=Brevundimonas sp. TaxID=1871086 RepID=UPI002732EF82|nr:cupin domain-containing protein [Brevundimonas sp.]MDP3404850.1 cupin domain-containing protein [Brevundimonas sp.]
MILNFSDLLDPVTPEAFTAEHRTRPLHIPAGASGTKRAILDWTSFNALLSQTSIWTPSNLRLVRDGETVPAEHYCTLAHTQSGKVMRPCPARVEVQLATGASLVANDIQRLTPGIAALCDTLGETFAGLVGANAYCSFGGVQAFQTHYDLHDVFAIQTEGEKVWRLYANRADDPVDPPPHADPRAFFAATRGPLMQEVRMRPGDVLYLPRGWYHDALATEGASLHLTLSVTPLYGRILFSLLEQAAMQDHAFRAWLPPAGAEGGAALSRHLEGLMKRLTEIALSPFLHDEIAMAQTRLVPRPANYALPERTALTLYRPTGLLGPRFPGPAAVAMGWALSQPQFALEDLIAQFDFISEDELREAVASAEQTGILRKL